MYTLHRRESHPVPRPSEGQLGDEFPNGITIFRAIRRRYLNPLNCRKHTNNIAAMVWFLQSWVFILTQ